MCEGMQCGATKAVQGEGWARRGGGTGRPYLPPRQCPPHRWVEGCINGVHMGGDGATCNYRWCWDCAVDDGRVCECERKAGTEPLREVGEGQRMGGAWRGDCRGGHMWQSACINKNSRVTAGATCDTVICGNCRLLRGWCECRDWDAVECGVCEGGSEADAAGGANEAEQWVAGVMRIAVKEEGRQCGKGGSRNDPNPGPRCPPHVWLVDCCNAPHNGGPGVTCEACVCWECWLEDPRCHCVMQRPGRDGCAAMTLARDAAGTSGGEMIVRVEQDLGEESAKLAAAYATSQTYAMGFYEGGGTLYSAAGAQNIADFLNVAIGETQWDEPDMLVLPRADAKDQTFEFVTITLTEQGARVAMETKQDNVEGVEWGIKEGIMCNGCAGRDIFSGLHASPCTHRLIHIGSYPSAHVHRPIRIGPLP